MKLLVVNPNTTVAVTELLARRVGAAVGASAEVEAVTARFGAEYIASEASYVVAAHAALEACRNHCDAHGRFAIVTGGAAWGPMLIRLARALELGDRLAGVGIVAATGAELAADPERALVTLAEACLGAMQGVEAVVLGGAALAGMAEAIASAATPRLAVPLIDSVDAAARAALASLR